MPRPGQLPAAGEWAGLDSNNLLPHGPVAALDQPPLTLLLGPLGQLLPAPAQQLVAVQLVLRQ